MPGEQVGTEEEFVSGSGTYVENGLIYSSIRGVLENTNHVLSVGQAQKLHTLKVGVNVVGNIDNISEPIALVVVQGEENSESRYSQNNEYLVLHASMIKRGYVRNMRDEYRIGDIIRAKIVEEKNGEFHISTEDENCGCIKAFCAGCRTPLEKKAGMLECPNCGRKENRKLASDYRSAAN